MCGRERELVRVCILCVYVLCVCVCVRVNLFECVGGGGGSKAVCLVFSFISFTVIRHYNTFMIQIGDAINDSNQEGLIKSGQISKHFKIYMNINTPRKWEKISIT